MTYSAQYAAIIERRLATPLSNDEYGEVHHIIPKSEGGGDEAVNLVRLTAREHYVCHLLCAKIYNDAKMYGALIYMQCKTKTHKRDFKFNSRLYAKMREEFGRKQSSRIPWNKGKRGIYSKETLKKMGEKHKLRTGEKNGFYGKHHTDEARKRISEANLGNTRFLGYHWWNNGKINKFAKECPGPGWQCGRQFV